ncbi:MAG: OadG family protein [Oscillospiraceae bacterium]|nr:OadG family protein [Oscillospiraceae bacterium]
MDLVNLDLGSGALIAVLGYCVVFLGIVMLLLVVQLMIRVMNRSAKKQAPVPAAPAPAPEPAPVPAEKAPGTAGDLKLYDTDPRDAAMIMAIVADKLGKPLNELRFISIKEVKDE